MEQTQKTVYEVVLLICVISAVECNIVEVSATNVSTSTNVDTLLYIHPVFKLSKFVNICCGVSFALMMLTVFIYLFLGIFRDAHAIIRLNLVFTLLILQLAIVFGVTCSDSVGTGAVITITIHWSGLAAFTWMLLEGTHIYSQITNGYGLEAFGKTLYISVGYVPSLVVVAISAAVNFNNYVEPYRRGSWMLGGSDVYWCFIVPILIILLMNLTLVAVVLRMLINPDYIDATWRKRAVDIKLTGRGLMVLGPVMQLYWCFFLLAVNGASTIFQNIFAALNVGQGVTLFTYQCLLDRKVRQAANDWCTRHSFNRLFSSEGQPTEKITKPSRLFERTKPAPCSIEENEADVQTDGDSLEHAHHTLQVQEYSNDAFVTEEETVREPCAALCPGHESTATLS